MAVLIMGLSDIGFCVFFRKYMCGVDVLDKVVVAFLMFCLVDFCVEFCVYLF